MSDNINVTITYSDRTYRTLNNTKFDTELTKAIKNSIESSPEMRKEMRRTFTNANKRIRRLQDSGVVSPALDALGDNPHFAMTGRDWETLKRDYAKAVSFMRQATSLVSGARDFERHMQRAANLNDALWQALKKSLIGGFRDYEGSRDFKYYQYVQDLYNKAYDDSKNWMEKIAVETEEQLQEDIDDTAKELAGQIKDGINDMLEGFANIG